MELRSLAEGDLSELRRIRRTPEVERWWGPIEHDFPTGDEPGATRLIVEVDGVVAGMVQFYEEPTPRFRHASVDLFIDPALHNRGIGAAAVRAVVRLLVEERGHHRVTIDPAVENAAAIRAYEKAGFRRVGVMRAYELDADEQGWHDGLLMEWTTPSGSLNQAPMPRAGSEPPSGRRTP
jgi:aminoglycoside 6'-N-acetyltransferase